MWRLVLVSFAALAVTFYELSGGSDYAPAPNSIQARADLVRPKARPEPANPGRRARTLARVEAAMDGPDQPLAGTAALSVTLASARGGAQGRVEDGAGQSRAAAPALASTDQADPSIAAAIAAALGEAPIDPAQIRQIKEGLVDLRRGPGLSFARVATIPRGTRVGILQDPGHGWLKVRLIDGYETGWLAEWLLTAPQ